MKPHPDVVIRALSSSYPCFGWMHCLSEVNGIWERRAVCEHPSYVSLDPQGPLRGCEVEVGGAGVGGWMAGLGSGLP